MKNKAEHTHSGEEEKARVKLTDDELEMVSGGVG